MTSQRVKAVSKDVVRGWAVQAAQIADDKKGTRTLVLDVGNVLAITDFFVITSASNNRLARTIADTIEETLGLNGGPVTLRREGFSEATWLLLDFGDLVVHVFTDEMRDFYEIERLYRDVPVVTWEPLAAASE